MHCHRIYWKPALGTAFLALAISSVTALPASAELTVADLTESAVSGVGPFHQDVADAIKRFVTGNYAAAFSKLESAKKSAPRLAPPEVMMAQLYFDANMSAPGIALLEKAARQEPPDPEPMVMLAERAMAERRILEAALLFEKAAPAVTKFTENPKRRQNLQSRLYSGSALVDEANQAWPEARKKLEELLTLEPQNATAHQRLGRALFHLGKGEQAYEHFKTAAAGDPTLPPADLAMAALFTDQANAEKWLKHALTVGAKDLRTQVAIGQYYFGANKLDEAKVHALEALKLDPNGFDSNALAGVVARMQGDYKTAEKHLAAAHLLNPAEALITRQLGLVLIEMPDDDSHRRALQFAELASKQSPDNLECLAALGWVCYRVNRRGDAQRAMNAVVNGLTTSREGKMNAEIAYFLGAISKDAGRLPYAERVLKDAVASTQPFAYRKSAEAMLAQIAKGEPAADDKAAGGPRGTRAAAKPATPASDKPASDAPTGGTP